jgi:glyoxylase I family protein
MAGFGFNHIAFNCRDVAAQERFYTKHFGFKRSRTFNRGQPNEFIMLKLGATRLEFFPTDSLKVADANAGEQAVGFKHLALDVPKLEPVIESLKADGVACDKIIECPHIAPGARIVFFRDLEGNIIELMEGYVDEV